MCQVCRPAPCLTQVDAEARRLIADRCPELFSLSVSANIFAPTAGGAKVELATNLPQTCHNLASTLPQTGLRPASYASQTCLKLVWMCGAQAMAIEYGCPYLGKLPLDPLLASTSELGRPIFDTHPSAPSAQPLKVSVACLRPA